jgi:hypothetical protein
MEEDGHIGGLAFGVIGWASFSGRNSLYISKIYAWKSASGRPVFPS